MLKSWIRNVKKFRCKVKELIEDREIIKKLLLFNYLSSYPGRKFAKTCAFCGWEVAYYSHVFSVYDVTITYNFPAAKRACFGELSSQGVWRKIVSRPENSLSYSRIYTRLHFPTSRPRNVIPYINWAFEI